LSQNFRSGRSGVRIMAPRCRSSVRQLFRCPYPGSTRVCAPQSMPSPSWPSIDLPVRRISGTSWLGRSASSEKSPARKIEIREQLQRRFACPVPPRKIFFFQFSEIYGSLPPSRAHLRGASRSSRTWSAGCDGRGGVAGRAMLARFRQNCGGPVPGLSRVVGGGVRVQQSRVVLAPRRWCQACAKPGFARRWGQESPVPQGARYKLSNHCAGKAGIVPTIPVVPSPCFSLCTGAAGVADARPSLRPLQ